MATKPTTKDKRIDFRIDAESKELFTRAAEISGLSLSAFMVDAVRDKAFRLIEEHNRVVLNNQARDMFMNVIVDPPAPNKALRRAANNTLLNNNN